MRTSSLCGLCLFAAALPALAQQPSITKIQNNYSYTAANSPNYGIAQGSLFIIAGANLAPSTQSASLTAGLPTTLNGVSVNVAVSGTTKPAYLYYTYASGSATQIGAVLPSSVSAGNGTLTVTVGSLTATANILVVPNDLGIDTLSGGDSDQLNGQGSGAFQKGLSSDYGVPGTISITDGSGGADVGPFNASFSYPATPLVWNEEARQSVDLSQPLSLTWSGGIPGTAVVISGFSGADFTQGGTKIFICVAPVSAQKFTVPLAVLGSLPPTASLDGLNSTAYMGVSNGTNPTPITASGINMGWISGLIYDNVGSASDEFVFE